jgi:hypothetical protein
MGGFDSLHPLQRFIDMYEKSVASQSRLGRERAHDDLVHVHSFSCSIAYWMARPIESGWFAILRYAFHPFACDRVVDRGVSACQNRSPTISSLLAQSALAWFGSSA